MYVIINIFLCESVSNQAKKTIQVATNCEKYFLGERGPDHDDLQHFIVVVNDNMPIFSAARFFEINRMTVFSTLNVVITFLIVMVQFERAKQSGCRESCDNETQNALH